MNKVVGILGGMGPMATVDLFQKIIENTPALVDQDHLRIIIDSNAKIPSRIDAIMQGTKTPLPEMIKSAKTLQLAGADLILIPCHTAHHWLEKLQNNVTIPVLNLIELTALYTRKHFTDTGEILLLASEAAVKLGLYEKYFKHSNVQLLLPGRQEQSIVSVAIKEVKCGSIKNNSHLEQLNSIIAKYQAKGILAVLGGCTEISLLFPYFDHCIKKIDPTLIMAIKTISLAQ